MATQKQIRQALHNKSVAGKIKDECDAWAIRIESRRLTDRQAFIDWLAQNFTSRQLALFLDVPWDDEVLTKHDYLYDAYLKSKLG